MYKYLSKAILLFCSLLLGYSAYGDSLKDVRLHHVVKYEGTPTYKFINESATRTKFIWSSYLNNYTIVCTLDLVAESQCYIEGDISIAEYLERISAYDQFGHDAFRESVE